MDLLSKAEVSRLRELERVVEAGIQTFYEVGTALAEIRDGRLYRTTHPTFEDYCQDRWDMTHGRANQIIRAAETVAGLDTIVSKPKTESQVRPLVQLPPEQRSETWREATESAPNGKVTAKHVQAVVDRRNGKAPEPEPEPPPFESSGRSLVNGVLREDPDDIARARAEGRIAAGVVPEVTTAEDDPEPESAAELGEDDLDDEAWLESLPLRAKLAGAALRWFDVDALLYRVLQPARETFRHHASRAMNVARRRGGSRGEYAYRLSRFLKLDHPRHWKLCPKPDDGGCGGAGIIGVIGECPRCHGRGYWIL